MSERNKKIWYCPTCGDTFVRGDRDPEQMACHNLHYTYPGQVWWEDGQSNEPLEALFVAAETGVRAAVREWTDEEREAFLAAMVETDEQ